MKLLVFIYAIFILAVSRTSGFQSTLAFSNKNVIRFNSSLGETSSSSRKEPEYVKVARKIFENDKRPVILFDGVCNLCNGGVNFALDFDPQGEFRFAALQSDIGKALLQRCGRSPDDISSIVLIDEKKAYLKSDAVLRIAKKLRFPVPLVFLGGMPVPRFIRDVVYDTVANNRYSILGKKDSCRLSDDRFEDRFIPDP